MSAARSESAARQPLQLVRDVAAPRELVWQAWTDPVHLAQWWGPHGYTSTVRACEPRRGGALRIDMHAADGTVYPMAATFETVAPPDRLVLLGTALDERGRAVLEVRQTITFAAVGNRTRVTVHVQVVRAEPAADPMIEGMQSGWQQSLERLADHALTAAASDREIVLSRVVDAPRDLVWRVWTDPAHLAQWWGPRGFTTTTRAMAVTVGGDWRYVMHGPDGRDYENRIHYLEVEAPARLRYKHGGDVDTEPVDFEVTTTFDVEADGRTRITMRSTFASAKARALVVERYGAIEGGKQTLARLGEHLAGMRAAAGAVSATAAASGGGRPFTIARVVRAPRDLVFAAWTQQEHLAQWFGPKGCTIPTCTVDLRPGGTFHYCMRSPGAADAWGKWVFRTIARPDRLVAVVSFADAAGNTVKAPFDPPWPLEMLMTVTFADHAGVGRGTLVTVESRALGNDARSNRTFDEGHGSLQAGWTGTFEQLEAFLARRSAGAAQ